MSELSSLLASVLPVSVHCKAYYIATPFVSSSPLFSPVPGQVQEPTECSNHLLLVTVDAGREGPKDEVIVFAIEVFVYTTTRLTTIFVSKADSTGNLGLLKVPAGTPSIIRSTSTAFLQFLINAQPKDRRIVLSLFARAQNQYLFPGSVENAGKHVLDDRQLIKWWCRTVDPILRSFKSETGGTTQQALDAVTAEAYVIVPGCDKYETRNFFPPSARNDSLAQPRWHATHPLYFLAGVEDHKTAAPPRCLVPRFPDDPKSRFLDDLDDEIRVADNEEIGNGGWWRSVRSLEQFWEMMSYRQECSAGRLVGFIWLVINPKQHEKPATQGQTSDPPVQASYVTSNGHEVHDEPSLPTPQQSQQVLTPAQSFQEQGSSTAGTMDPMPESHNQIPESPPPSSPLIAPTEIIDFDPAPDPAVPQLPVQPSQLPTTSPLTLTIPSYDALVSHLTNDLDFSSLPLAIDATKSFLKFASDKGGLSDNVTWQGIPVTGTLNPGPFNSAVGQETAGVKRDAAPVNVIMGVRKKRKATTDDESVGATQVSRVPGEVTGSNNRAAEAISEAREQGSEAQVTTLSAGLIRKKNKTQS